jgi:hypothetical protein
MLGRFWAPSWPIPAAPRRRSIAISRRRPSNLPIRRYNLQLNLAAAYHALGKKEEEEQAMERYRELSASKDTNE